MMFSPGCCCTAGDLCCGCSKTAMPAHWDLAAFSSISGSDKCLTLPCDTSFGGVTLDRFQDTCIWTRVVGDVFYNLRCRDAGDWGLSIGWNCGFGQLVGASYVLPAGVFACNATNVMPFEYSLYCTGWPANVTLTPS